MLRIFLYFFTLIFLLTTCKKSGYGYVRGTVVEEGTGLPIEGAKVWVEDTKHGSTHHNETATAISDANGNYIIRYNKKPTRRYFLYCRDGNHFDDFDSEELTYKKTAVTIQLKPFAYLKLRIKKNSTSLNYVDVAINNTIEINGVYKNYPHVYDTIIPDVYAILGNSINTVSWYLNYNPPTTSNYTFYQDSFYASKGDTVTYLIQFN